MFWTTKARPESPVWRVRVKRSHLLVAVLLLGLCLASPGQSQTAQSAGVPPNAGGITGSEGCKSCHKIFHDLWATSFHGLAMRPFTETFSRQFLTSQAHALTIGRAQYQAVIGAGQGWIAERIGGKEKTYPITYVLGGKNVFYFLTPLGRGKLQTLPLAYDVRTGEWFDMAASGVRHFPGGNASVDWKAWPYTFNTACRGCHVSQLSTGYDAAKDAYSTTWREPGINCESCHGPGKAHVEACLSAPKDSPPKDLKIIRGGRSFSAEQNNALCSSCHAKARQFTSGMQPGERFYDHFDLTAYESPDYAPDGRDLGENYTYTSWSRSPCVRSGKLDCLHCHTSSGRYKFADPLRANEACLPCHAQRVAEAPQHSHHPQGTPGSRCVSCHMPMTSFARMHRSDHSMLPPTPATTLAFNSPNACNGCHKDRDAAWADAKVRAWSPRDYQAPVLRMAGLIAAARKGDWARLPEMLQCLTDGQPGLQADAVVKASLLRLLRACPAPAKWDAVLRCMSSSSPLVRGAAAEALATWPSRQAAHALLSAVSDDFRLVRIQAAAALSALPGALVKPNTTQARALAQAKAELLASLKVRPDLWTSQYNLGNHYLVQGDNARALRCYNAALQLNPEGVQPLVNAAMAHARMGDAAKAKEKLEKALRQDPNNAPAHFNLGLLQAEQGDLKAAQEHLRASLRLDPTMAEAAFNLGLLLSENRPGEALHLLKQAVRLQPQEPRFSYTLAFYMNRAGDQDGAIKVLTKLLRAHPQSQEATLLLRQIQSRRP